MIAIINDGSNPAKDGLHHYRVQINDKVICEFDHVRGDGLAECLRKAAAAVDSDNAAYEEVDHRTRVISEETARMLRGKNNATPN